MPKMRLILATLAAMATAVPAPAAPQPSPPVFWAGCAGALVVKAQRGGQGAGAGPAQLARRALAQAKIAANPDKLSETQINGVAISAARSFTEELKRDPAREPAFENAVRVCTDAIGKLPA